MGTRKGPPTKGAIVRANMLSGLDESALGCDWDEADRRCWCCGKRTKTEKAHCEPHMRGGPNDPINFVLLCKRCHVESPDVDRDVMLRWLADNSSTMHGDRWHTAALSAAAMRMDPPDRIPDTDEAAAAVSEVLSRCGIHQGKFSQSTLEWAMAEVLGRLGWTHRD